MADLSFLFQRRRGHPLHDAAEEGDIDRIRELLLPPQPPTPTQEEANGMEQDAMEVDEDEVKKVAEKAEEGGGDAGEETKEQEMEEAEGEEEEEEEEEEVNSEEDEDYEASGGEDDDDDDEDDDEEGGSDGDDDDEDGGGREAMQGPPQPAPVFDVNALDNFDCTALHVAIHARQLEAAKVLLEHNADPTKTTEKSTALHTAVSLAAYSAHRKFALQAIKLLSTYPIDVNAKDDNLQTPLHLAAHIGHIETIQALFEIGAKESLAFRDRYHLRPLHLAAKGGHAEAVKLLAEAGADLQAADMYGKTALHVAARLGHWDVVVELASTPVAGSELVKMKDKKGNVAGDFAVKRGTSVPDKVVKLLGIRPSDLASAPGAGKKATEAPPQTLVVTDASCLRHFTCPPITRSSKSDLPPENVNRLKVLLNDETGSLRSDEFSGCEWLSDVPPASLGDVLKCHEYKYLETVRRECLGLPDSEYAIGHLDGDTAISRGSWEAALKAAGATCAAIDRVVEGKNKNAFCAVRPPGHHAGSRGVVTEDPAAGSHGFCLINNVAVGAAYARNVYRHRGIRKIAIVDFDVHHGNGTEEIVENLVPQVEEHVEKLPWCTARFAAMKYMPWLNEDDAKETLFISVHGYGGRNIHGMGSFYPGSGRTRIPQVEGYKSEKEADDDDEEEEPQFNTRGDRKPQVLNIGMELVNPTESAMGTSRTTWRRAVRDVVLPRLAAFGADLIIISAGFDAHRRDTINMGYIGLVEEDYEWITGHLVRIANATCEGRIVSVLEGGYRIQGGCISPFARSVAAHVRALVQGRATREPYDEEDVQWETEYDIKVQEARERKLMNQMMATQKVGGHHDNMATGRRRVAEREGLGGGGASSSPLPVAGGVVPPPSSWGILTKTYRTMLMSTATLLGGGGDDENEEVGPKKPPVEKATPSSAPPAEKTTSSQAPEPAAEEGGGRRSKRKAAGNVDYVALAKKLKEEEEKEKAATAEGATGGAA